MCCAHGLELLFCFALDFLLLLAGFYVHKEIVEIHLGPESLGGRSFVTKSSSKHVTINLLARRPPSCLGPDIWPSTGERKVLGRNT